MTHKISKFWFGISILALCQMPELVRADDIEAVSKFVKNQKLEAQFGESIKIYNIASFDALSQNSALKILNRIKEEIDFSQFGEIEYFIDGEKIDTQKQDLNATLTEIPYELIDQLELQSETREVEETSTEVLRVNIISHHITMFSAKRNKFVQPAQNYGNDRFASNYYGFTSLNKIKTDFSTSASAPQIKASNSVNIDSKGAVENRDFNRSQSQSSLSKFSAVYNEKIGDNDLIIDANTKTSVFSRAWNYFSSGWGDNKNNSQINSNKFGTSNNISNNSELSASYLFGGEDYKGKIALGSSYKNIDEQYESSVKELDASNYDISFSHSQYFEIKSLAALDRSFGGNKLSLGNEYIVRKMSRSSLYGEGVNYDHALILQPSSSTNIEEFMSNTYAETKYRLAPKLSLNARFAVMWGNTRNNVYNIADNNVYYVPNIRLEYAKDDNTVVRASFKKNYGNFYYGEFSFLGNVNNGSALDAEKINIAELEFEKKFPNDVKLSLELTNKMIPNKIGLVPVYSGNTLSGQTLANGLDESFSGLSARINYPFEIAGSEYIFLTRFDYGLQSASDVFDKVSGDRINTNRQLTEFNLKRKVGNSGVDWGAFYKYSSGDRYFSYDEAVVVPQNSTIGMFVNYKISRDAALEAEFSAPISENNNVIRTKYNLDSNNVDYINIRPLDAPSFRLTLKSAI
jgi:hypothetical protein